MNKFSYIPTLVLLLVVFIFPNLVKAQDSLATDKLVAYYPFSGSAADSSGFGNDGEVFGATLTRDRFGNENSAYEFDGVDDLINFGNDSAFNVTGALTLSVWAKGVGQPTGVTALIGKTSFDSEVRGGMAPYGIALDDGDRLYTYIRNNEENLGILYEGLVTDPEEWIHYVSVFKPNEYLKLYRNGELLENVVTNVPDSISLEPQRPLVAGARTHTDNLDVIYYFDGALDDIRIYSEVLSDTLVKDLYSENGWPETKYVLPDTLVAHYPFDGNAADSSGFENDGEVFGATLTKDRFGNENSAYEFDGIDDFIDGGSSESLRITGDLTLSFWFKADSFEGLTSGIITYQEVGTSGSERNALYKINFPNDNVLNYNHESDQGEDHVHRFDSVKFASNRWYHAVLIRDTTMKKLKLYIDGVLASTTSFEKAPNGGEISYLRIGENQGTINSDRFFDGVLDDVRIYNYAVSDSLVSNLYSENGWPETKYVLPDTLVAYYPFSGNAADSSGFENDGEVFGAALTRDRFGNENSAYKLDGDNDFIDIGNDQSLDLAKGFTFSVWAKGNSSEESLAGLISKANGGYPYFLGIDDGDRILLRASSGDGVNYPEIIVNQSKEDINDWHHYVGVFKSSEYLKIYKDGIEVGVLEDSVLAETQVSYSNTWIGAGRHHTDIWRTYHFEGILDDIRIYNYAVSDSSVLDMYYEGGWPETKYVLPDTLVAHYPFDGNAEDISGFGNFGEVFGATLTRDRFGNENSAYRFDGNNDFIDGGSSESLKITGDLTLSFWFNADSFDGVTSGILTYQGSNTSGSERNALYKINFPNDNILNYNHEGGEGTDNVHRFENAEFIANEWYHTVLTRDTIAKELKLFINGTQVDSAVFDVLPLGGELSSLRIGENHGTVASDRFFDGTLDDIRIYNYAISDSAIYNLYSENGWVSPTDTTNLPENVLAAYYQLDGNAADSSGFGNDGSIVGASISEDRFDREGMAYEFDGIDDFIRINNPENLHSQKNLSFSFWAKGTSQDSTFRSFISTVNNDPFNFAIDNGDRLLFTVQTREIPLNLTIEDLVTNPGSWYHYAAVYRAGDYLRVYRDGIELGSLYGTIPRGINLTSEEVFFGASVTRTESNEDALFFKGSLDEIRFYNHDLSDDQVDSVFVEESKTPVSSESENFIPEEFKLYQNYPNPFNPSTVIGFDIPENGLASLKVYDLTGRLVATLIDNNVSAGRYQLTFNAARLSSGVYFYELKTNAFSTVKKFTLIK